MLIVRFTSPLLIGGVEPQLGGADRATLVDEAGLPLLPVSALKGAWRIELERLSRALRPDDLPGKAPACALLDDDASCMAGGDAPCIACHVFGNPTHAGKLRIHSPRLRGEDARAWFSNEVPTNISPVGAEPSGRGYEARWRVAINRRRLVAEDRHLFVFEGTEAGLDLEYEAPLEWWGAEADLERLWPLLQAAARMIPAIGGARSVGFGRCQVTVEGRPAVPAPIAAAPGTNGTNLLLIFRLEQPACVALPRRPESFAVESHSHIPATVVRGGLATALLRANGEEFHRHPTFARLFLDPAGPVRFDDAYPVGTREPLPGGGVTPSIRQIQSYGASRPFVAPMSALTCKRQPGAVLGSAASTSDEEPHGVFDSLLLRAAIRQFPADSIAHLLRPGCPRCPAPSPTKPWRRLLSLTAGAVPNPALGTLTRVALSRRTGRARDEQLYSLQAVRAHTVLVGRVRNLQPEDSELLAGLSGRHVEVGSARSRGLGRCRLLVAKPVEAPDPWLDGNSSVDDRLREMQSAWDLVVKAVAGTAGCETSVPGLQVFSVTLCGDAILGGEDQPMRVRIHPEDLGAGTLATKAIPLASLVQQGVRRGFHDLHRARKPQEVVSTAGGTALFGVPEGVIRSEDLLAELSRLEASGIGRRRSEGFGEVAVCHRFHSAYATRVM